MGDRYEIPESGQVMDPTNTIDDRRTRVAADRSRRSNRRRMFAMLAVACSGMASASAASLGGLGGRSLGADRGVVASCDTNGVTLVKGPIVFTPAMNAFTMSTFSVRTIAAACRGRTLFLTLRDPSNVAIATISAAVGGTRVNLTLGTPVRVSQIAGVAIAIK